MQTFRYRNNSGFQPLSRRFLARIKFQMPMVCQRIREADGEQSSYLFWGVEGSGGGSKDNHSPEKQTGN